MNEGHSVPKQTHDLEITETSDGIVIQNGEQIHILNETAREIFQMCDGTHTVLEIIDEMIQKYTGEDIDRSIEQAISNFLKLNIIQLN